MLVDWYCRCCGTRQSRSTGESQGCQFEQRAGFEPHACPTCGVNPGRYRLLYVYVACVACVGVKQRTGLFRPIYRSSHKMAANTKHHQTDSCQELEQAYVFPTSLNPQYLTIMKWEGEEGGGDSETTMG